jgi:DNA-binding transcriptional regulator PaaX
VVLPDLTDAGFKSLLFLLEKKQLLRINKLENEFSYALSSYAESLLEEKFPALSSKNDTSSEKWSVILFLESPKTDKNFRYLRNFLTKNKAIALTRGVFLYPGSLAENIKKELASSYRNAVAVMSLDQWLIGDEYTIIGQRAGLEDLFNLYSGISSQLDSLIIILNEKKDAKNQQKETLNSVFERFLEAISVDSSLLQRYFPQVEDAKGILEKLQKALEI